MLRIGIDVGGTGIQNGLVTKEGRILCKGTIETRTDLPFEEQVAQMAKSVLDTIDRSDFTLEDVESIGVGVPGVIDTKTGNIAFCANLGWFDAPYREEMQKYIDKPVYLNNDATVAGLAESKVGISAEASSSVFITLGTGVGGGIVIDGKPWSGAHGVGSEIGHMIMEVDGEPCSCGNHGCLERYCSATAIIRMARELVKVHRDSMILEVCNGDAAKINARTVIDCAREGDPVAVKVFRRYVKYLAQAICSIICFFDPEIIVLGGGVSKAGPFLLDAVREEVPHYLLFKTLPYPRIELARLGADAGIIGASMLTE